MIRLTLICLLFWTVPPSLTQDSVEIFKAEIFLDRTELDSGLYEGKVKGRRLFGETQIPHGKGTIYYFTNDRFNRQNYSGDWENGTREGNGTTHFKDGAVYIGQYKDSLESGVGSIQYPNGNYLEAEFRDGKIEGHGVFKYENGDQREGFFSENTLDGQVIYTRNDGVTVIEKWTNGTRVEDRDVIVQDGVNFADTVRQHNANGHKLSGKTEENGGKHTETPASSADSGIDLEQIKKAIRSGDRVALFSSERRPKSEETVDFEAVGKRAR